MHFYHSHDERDLQCEVSALMPLSGHVVCVATTVDVDNDDDDEAPVNTEQLEPTDTHSRQRGQYCIQEVRSISATVVLIAAISVEAAIQLTSG